MAVYGSLCQVCHPCACEWLYDIHPISITRVFSATQLSLRCHHHRLCTEDALVFHQCAARAMLDCCHIGVLTCFDVRTVQGKRKDLAQPKSKQCVNVFFHVFHIFFSSPLLLSAQGSRLFHLQKIRIGIRGIPIIEIHIDLQARHRFCPGYLSDPVQLLWILISWRSFFWRSCVADPYAYPPRAWNPGTPLCGHVDQNWIRTEESRDPYASSGLKDCAVLSEAPRNPHFGKRANNLHEAMTAESTIDIADRRTQWPFLEAEIVNTWMDMYQLHVMWSNVKMIPHLLFIAALHQSFFDRCTAMTCFLSSREERDPYAHLSGTEGAGNEGETIKLWQDKERQEEKTVALSKKFATKLPTSI